MNILRVHSHTGRLWERILDQLWDQYDSRGEMERIIAFNQAVKAFFIREHAEKRGLGFQQRLVCAKNNLNKVKSSNHKEKYDKVIKELKKFFSKINKTIEEDIEAYAKSKRVVTFKPTMFSKKHYIAYEFFFAKDNKLPHENKHAWIVGPSFEEMNKSNEPMSTKADYEYDERFDVEATLLYLLDRGLKTIHNSQFGFIWDKKPTDAIKALQSALKKLPKELEVKYNEGAELKYYKVKRSYYNDFK